MIRCAMLISHASVMRVVELEEEFLRYLTLMINPQSVGNSVCFLMVSRQFSFAHPLTRRSFKKSITAVNKMAPM